MSDRIKILKIWQFCPNHQIEFDAKFSHLFPSEAIHQRHSLCDNSDITDKYLSPEKKMKGKHISCTKEALIGEDN